MKKSIYAVFDVGKTNKKLILFDEDRQIIEEKQHVCLETVDEDGFPCESLTRLTQWVQTHWHALRTNPHYHVKGVNFTSYGASFVHLGANGQPVLPLYNYLKPLPAQWSTRFYDALGQTPEEFAAETCSPRLDMLNSGLQLYWLKYARPEHYARIRTSLHLPQYLSYLITGEAFSDYTSVGCHTSLWDFNRQHYHDWVLREGIDEKLAPLTTDSVAAVVDGVLVGVGLHDSSAAVLPYLLQTEEPFLLVSTGTWAITLNPFNDQPLTPELLRRDCLSYLSPKGHMTKAARVFFGREHDYQVERIANYFHVQPDFFHSLVLARPYDEASHRFRPWCMVGTGPFPEQPAEEWDLSVFKTAGDAYQHLMHGLIDILKESINLIRQDEKILYVDGGFARNPPFMQVLSWHFPELDIRTLEVPQATALGALSHLVQGEAWSKTQPLFT
ncbi:carbohydrate kinase [Hymenobacter busanensis]|uniref:Carbohydrate kinase n=1 Tax=Hymenobacter busanensis TaxID=2607656 RepID=A0A7L5A159_9BACT|nr:FGGY family carbohydrate kinase [Hymenobacter busanensis]KAA9331674.1 carbohydrate kinase [Hymenobacter busanensis]QHJ08826.1 carbohydrate kinase [Hymenobacter busanensis]